MARMFPDVDPAQLEHRPEATVYAALREQLGADYSVLHSYPWLRPARADGALAEGEADFVILHPTRGLLVLEVKGGEELRYEGHRWQRRTGDGFVDIKNPFEQARRNKYALLEMVEERSGGRVRRDQLVYGYAVVLPECRYEGALPADVDERIVIAAQRLPHLGRAIERAYDRWTAAPTVLTPSQYGHLTDCIMPKFRVMRRIGPDIANASDALLELTETQARVLEGFFAHPRLLVHGVAGSGKTFLAVARARLCARGQARALRVLQPPARRVGPRPGAERPDRRRVPPPADRAELPRPRRRPLENGRAARSRQRGRS